MALPKEFSTPLFTCAKPVLDIPSLSESLNKPCPEIKKNRCGFEGCKKKLSLTDLSCKCKCGLIHCSTHRPAEVHKCTFDFKAGHTTELLKTMNTAVVAAKIDKI